MPYVRITVAGAELRPEQRTRLHHEITELMARLLGKDPALTVVSIGEEPAGHWSAGGIPLEGSARNAQLEAFITMGSNTVEEKSAFIAAADKLLRQVLGDEHFGAPLYVMVQEVCAVDWGYDGLSQLARRQRALARSRGAIPGTTGGAISGLAAGHIPADAVPA